MPASDRRNPNYANYDDTSNDTFGKGYLFDAAQLRWFCEQYKPDPQHWRAAPVHADLAGSPSTLVVTAELDPLRDQGTPMPRS
jgi:acetyl esterase